MSVVPYDVARAIDDLANSELRQKLTHHGLSEFMVEMLVADRETAGGRWRIAEVLRP
jgi:hypothetical protein